MDFPASETLVLRIVLAGVVGLVLGLERELSNHPAGVRTHIGVALGACLFGVVSGYGFAGFEGLRSETNYQVDPTRVASNIAVGIGFLGGGVILKHGLSVRGLTTAASLWVTAAAGLGIALGMYAVTLATVGVMVVSLVALRAPRRWLQGRLRVRESVAIDLAQGADPGAVISALRSLPDVDVRSLSIRSLDGRYRIDADLQAQQGGADLAGPLSGIAGRDDVEDLDLG